MSVDVERFTTFVRDRAAAYNAPPETPRNAMWVAVESTLAPAMEARRSGEAVADPVVAATVSDDGLVDAAGDYNVPPVTPHDEMWERIESAWDLRRTAPPPAREAGLDELEAPEWEAAPGRRRALGWMTAVGLAASLVIGFALGRTTVGPTPAGADAEALATADGTPETGGLTAASEPVVVEVLESAPASTGDSGTPATRRVAPPLESGARLAAATEPVIRAGDAAGSAPAASNPASRWNVAVRLATAKHLGQAETLLTSFRADTGGEPSSGGGHLAGWARDLLGETRLLLDLPVDRGAQELELLEELELVLAQIARLGPEAPAFERDLVADGIVRQGTIARLRAASPPGAGEAVGT